MQDKIQSFTPFVQKPLWQDDQSFTITGAELRAIQRVCEDFSTFIPIVEGIFDRFLQDKSIQVKYEDLQGNPLTPEQIHNMLKEFAEMQPEDQPNI